VENIIDGFERDLIIWTHLGYTENFGSLCDCPIALLSNSQWIGWPRFNDLGQYKEENPNFISAKKPFRDFF
jgi:hypothetical protein